MGVSRRAFLKASAALAGASLTPPLALATPNKPAVSDIAQRAVKAHVSPAVQVALCESGRIVENAAFGLANLDTRAPASPDTIFGIGSLTKQVTGVIVLKLATEGKLGLDEPAAKYLPPFAGQPAFTVRELLHHTAGIHEDEAAPAITGPVTQVRLAEAIARQSKLFDFPPGTAWLYSNANYILLGAIAEAVTGHSLQQLCDAYVSAPLSLHGFGFAGPVTGRATGYSLADGGGATFQAAAVIDISQAGAAGAMHGTAYGLARFHQAVLFGSLLTEPERAAFLAPATLRDGRPSSANRFSADDRAMGDTQYGFGVNLDTSTRDRSLIVHHNGFISGYSAYLATHVPSRRTVACVCNVDPHPGLPFRELRRTVFKDYL